jgi:hypothetical protein
MRVLRLRSGVALSGYLITGLLACTGWTATAYAQAAAAPAPRAEAKPADLPSARAIFDRHIEAIGGRKAIASHSSSRVTGSMAVPAAGMNGTIEVIAAKPNKALVKITIPGVGEMIEGFDGTTGWTINPMTGPALSQGKMLDEKKFDSDFFGELKDESRYQSTRTLEKTMFDGRECYKVSLVRKGGGEDIEFYDVKTGLKAGQMGQRETPMGTVPVTQTFSDYQKFGDMLQPTTLKIASMGMEQVLTVTSVEYDKVDPAAFELPAQIKALVK